MPRWARLFFRLALPAHVRHSALADLADGFATRAAAEGERSAGRWLWSQAVRTLGPGTQLARLGRAGGVFGTHVAAALRFDIRRGARALRTAPAFSATVVLIIALGAGVATALYTVAEHTVLSRPPYPGAERLYVLREANDAVSQDEGAAPANLLDWRARTSSFEGIASWRPMPLVAYGPEVGEFIRAARVTRDFFDVIGVAPEWGRALTSGDFDGAWYDSSEDYIGARGLTAIVTHELATRRYGDVERAVGATFGSELGPIEIVGVMPPGFRAPLSDAELWLPLEYRPDLGGRNSRYVDVIARLGADRSIAEARADLDRVSAFLSSEYPDTNGGWTVEAIDLHRRSIAGHGATLATLAVAVLCLLFIAFLNVSAMQIARWASRERDLALRRTLGASRGRLAQQLAIETALLCAAGGALGVVVAIPVLRVLLASSPRWAELAGTVTPNPVVFAAVVGAMGVTGLASAFAPALRLSRASRRVGSPAGSRSVGHATGRLRHILVTAEVAVTLALLVAAGLLSRSFLNVRSVDPGFEAKDAVVLRLFLDKARYGWDESYEDSPRDYFPRLAAHLETLPFVESAGGVQALPMLPANTIDFARPYWRTDEPRPPGDSRLADIRLITPHYFRALGMRRVAGREFDERDGAEGPPVVVVNESLARRLFPEEPAVGRELMIDYPDTRAVRIVGVVADVRFYGLHVEPRPEIYLPHAQMPYRALSMVVKVDGDPETSIPALTDAVLELDSRQPVLSALLLDRLVEGSVADRRFAARVVASIAIAAILLAATAIYGLLAYLVAQGRRAIGVRMALGARSSRVGLEILGESMQVVGRGIITGLAVAVPLVLAIRSQLFGVSLADGWVLAAATALLALLATIAAAVPAYRAARTDPAEVIRAD